MLIKRFTLIAALAATGAAFADVPSDLQIKTTRPDATVAIERGLADNKALVSVLDAKKAPVLGLSAADFAVVRAGEAARADRSQAHRRHVIKRGRRPSRT